MNNLILTGNIVRNLELHNEGKSAYLRNAIAVSTNKKDESGRYISEFFNFTVFGSSAEYLAKYGYVGCKIALMGRVHMNSYEKEGKKHNEINIVADNIEIMTFKPKEDNYSTNQANQFDIKEEDLPF